MLSSGNERQLEGRKARNSRSNIGPENLGGIIPRESI
jgi:hypothetical protein